ncbi:hypothetical protein ACJWDR_29010 [Streptomyces tauricus]|uniref:hypothetical protein n=1 Tax=Streptomyces tauricus TaxID=68274 RepID=UPI00387F2BD4
MTELLAAVLAGSAGWIWGHNTARIKFIHIGATREQDQAALDQHDRDLRDSA